MSPSVCGVYIPEIPYGEFTIPYTDFLKGQTFSIYLISIYGELLEPIHASPDAFVRAPISLVVMYEHYEIQVAFSPIFGRK